MSEDDPEARRTRADRLRKQIAKITGEKQAEAEQQDESESTPGGVPKVRPLSPRQFIEKRMQEIDSGEDETNEKRKDRTD